MWPNLCTYGRAISLAGLVVLALSSQDAVGEPIYQYKDNKGVLHFSNVPNDPRYRTAPGDARVQTSGSPAVPNHPVTVRSSQPGEIRAWGHGPLQGNVSIADPQTVVLDARDVKPYQFVEGSILLPRNDSLDSVWPISDSSIAPSHRGDEDAHRPFWAIGSRTGYGEHAVTSERIG